MTIQTMGANRLGNSIPVMRDEKPFGAEPAPQCVATGSGNSWAKLPIVNHVAMPTTVGSATIAPTILTLRGRVMSSSPLGRGALPRRR